MTLGLLTYRSRTRLEQNASTRPLPLSLSIYLPLYKIRDQIVGFHDATRLATLRNSAMPGPLTPIYLSTLLAFWIPTVADVFGRVFGCIQTHDQTHERRRGPRSPSKGTGARLA